MSAPDLRKLQGGDGGAWDEAFAWLWPTVFAVAQLKLQPFLPDEIEDVAIESLEALVEKVREVRTVEELKPLAASIAHHRAVSLLRERFAKKRGEGKTESLDATTEDGDAKHDPASPDSPLDSLEEKELAERLRKSLAALKPPLGDVLSDFFLHGLRYEEIATKRGIAIGSVGVYLKRGLEALRRIWAGARIVERNERDFAMNSMNDERFFDLAMKVIARQCTDAERAELNALLAGQPELKGEFERLRAEVGVAKEALPLVNATEATAGELPAYARGRLQTKVRQTLGQPQTAGESKSEREQSMMWAWRWALGLAAATAVIVLLVLPTFRTSSEPVIQVAMLDTGGATRGGDTNEVAAFRQSWEKATVALLRDAGALRAWETNWPGGSKQSAIKIIYDRAAGEVRVLGRWEGKTIEKTFLIEQDLATTLKQAKDFIQTQTKR